MCLFLYLRAVPLVQRCFLVGYAYVPSTWSVCLLRTQPSGCGGRELLPWPKAMVERVAVRRNGFERPFHHFQVLSWVVFGSDVVLFCLFCVPLVDTIVAKAGALRMSKLSPSLRCLFSSYVSSLSVHLSLALTCDFFSA